MENSRITEARQLARQIEDLKSKFAALGLTAEESEAIRQAVPARKPAARPASSVTGGRGKMQSHRQLVLDGLAEVGHPMLSRDIQAYLGARHGETVEATRFGSLRRTEMEAYERGGLRPVWLAYGLTDRGEAVKRLLGRSDWPLEERVVGPLTGRRLFFQLTAQLCRIFLDDPDLIVDPDAFKILIADHARDLPGMKNFRKGQFDIEGWLGLAERAVAGVLEKDAQDRSHIARRLTMLSPLAQVFGTDIPADDQTIMPPITSKAFAS